MHDTQWPRWEVFKQDTPRKPHQAVGSVHAPDAETALLTARNVFVRRPKAVSLWVTPADAVLARTREQLSADTDWQTPADPVESADPPQPYAVFTKSSQRRAMTFVDHIDTITAASPAHALAAAVTKHGGVEAAWVWWIVAEADLHRSEPDAADSWFDPALDKTYRQQSSYGFVAPRRRQRDPRNGAEVGNNDE